MATCGRRFDKYAANTTAVFEELSILAAFPTPTLEADLDADDSAVFPVASTSSIMPLEPEAYTYDVITEGRLTYFNYTLRDFGEELYSFGVWGRVYATDGEEADPPIEESEDPDAAHSHLLSGVLLVPVLALVIHRF